MARGYTWVYAPKSIPAATQAALRARLEAHAHKAFHNTCRSLIVRFRGAFAYVDAVPMSEDYGGHPLHLCRLGYLGSVDRWNYAFFKYSTEHYAPSLCASGSFVATPEQALDSAAGAYLGD